MVEIFDHASSGGGAGGAHFGLLEFDSDGSNGLDGLGGGGGGGDLHGTLLGVNYGGIGTYSFSTENADYYESNDGMGGDFVPADFGGTPGGPAAVADLDDVSNLLGHFGSGGSSSPVSGVYPGDEMDEFSSGIGGGAGQQHEHEQQDPHSTPFRTSNNYDMQTPGSASSAFAHNQSMQSPYSPALLGVSPMRQGSQSEDILNSLLGAHPDVEAVDLFRQHRVAGGNAADGPEMEALASAASHGFHTPERIGSGVHDDDVSDDERADERYFLTAGAGGGDFVEASDSDASGSSDSSDGEMDDFDSDVEAIVIGVAADAFEYQQKRAQRRRSRSNSKSSANMALGRKRHNRMTAEAMSQATMDQYGKDAVHKTPHRSKKGKKDYKKKRNSVSGERNSSKKSRRRRERQEELSRNSSAGGGGTGSGSEKRHNKSRLKSNAGRSQHSMAPAATPDAYFRFQEVMRISNVGDDDEDEEVDIC